MIVKNLYKKILSKAFDIPIEVTFWDHETNIYNSDLGMPKIHVTFTEPLNLKELANHATLALAEAYMDKKILIDGSIQELVASAFRTMAKSEHSFHKFQNVPKMSHSKKASKNDVQSHYDLGNDFYCLWLDKNMVYSCAYFKDGNYDDLDKAQMDKIYHILNKLNSSPGKTLLDIGCGWGDILFIGAKEYGLKTTGITLSQEQYDYVNQKIKEEHLQDQVSVLLKDYRDVQDIQFDYITSVGMFEHVGKENLGEYFATVKSLLKDDGYALIHGITSQHRHAGVDPFIIKYIFPGGYVPGIEEMITHIIDQSMQISDLEFLRRHYQRTLEIWDQNFNQHRELITQMFDERFVRMWDLYLQSCAGSFESGNIDVMQFLISKQPSGANLPMTRAYMK